SVPNALWYGGAPNPFQLTVRYNILNASGNIKVKEIVRRRDWAASFSPHFRLDNAAQPPHTYEPQDSHLFRAMTTNSPKTNRKAAGWAEAYAIQTAVAEVGRGPGDYELADD